MGQDLEAKIIELDKNRNNVVLSAAPSSKQTQSVVRTGFLNQLQKGQVRTGVISSIVNFGAFVDLGGVDGLVHVSELSWKHIDHPQESSRSARVTVEVLDVDMDRERVSLSLKAPRKTRGSTSPGPTPSARSSPAGSPTGSLGAFVRVAEGIEGLVHISELASATWEIPGRSSRSTTRSSSRSSTSTSNAAASPCR